jgi:hypothetical protein
MSPLGNLAAEVLDLNSQSQIEDALRKHHVDTVVSTYWLYPNDWQVEVVLVKAAEAAGVRRFAPSCFSFPNNQCVKYCCFLMQRQYSTREESPI